VPVPTTAPPLAIVTDPTSPDPSSSPPGTAVGVLVVVPPDRAAEGTAVAGAFDELIEGGDRTALEDDEALDPALQDGRAATPGGSDGVTVDVLAVTFSAEDTAEVAFEMDSPAWGAPVRLSGTAVRVDGRWQVSASTMCMLLARVGVTCPTGP
jgi:hypothetical protein